MAALNDDDNDVVVVGLDGEGEPEPPEDVLLTLTVLDIVVMLTLEWFWAGGLVVMGDDSCSTGRGSKSWHRILDENNISHIDLL